MQTKALQTRGRQATTRHRLADAFYEKVTTGTWEANQKIPSEHELAQEYQVSRETVRKALQTLEQEGLLRAQRGSGRIVVPRKYANTPTAPRTLGLIVYHFARDGYGEMDGIHQVARDRNYDILLYAFQPYDESGQYDLKTFRSHDVAGIFTLCAQIEKRDLISLSTSLPTVAFLHQCADFGIPSYYPAFAWAMDDICRHLFESGFDTHICLVRQEPYLADVTADLLKGYRHAHHAKGIPVQPDNIITESNRAFRTPRSTPRPYSTDCLEPVFHRLENGQKLAVISYSNAYVLELANYAVKHGIDIPGQLALVALQDTDTLLRSPIPITAAKFDRRQSACNAVTHLIDMIEDKVDPDYPLDNPTYGTLIIRESTC